MPCHFSCLGEPSHPIMTGSDDDANLGLVVPNRMHSEKGVTKKPRKSVAEMIVESTKRVQLAEPAVEGPPRKAYFSKCVADLIAEAAQQEILAGAAKRRSTELHNEARKLADLQRELDLKEKHERIRRYKAEVPPPPRCLPVFPEMSWPSIMEKRRMLNRELFQQSTFMD